MTPEEQEAELLKRLAHADNVFSQAFQKLRGEGYPDAVAADAMMVIAMSLLRTACGDKWLAKRVAHLLSQFPAADAINRERAKKSN